MIPHSREDLAAIPAVPSSSCPLPTDGIWGKFTHLFLPCSLGGASHLLKRHIPAELMPALFITSRPSSNHEFLSRIMKFPAAGARIHGDPEACPRVTGSLEPLVSAYLVGSVQPHEEGGQLSPRQVHQLLSFREVPFFRCSPSTHYCQGQMSLMLPLKSIKCSSYPTSRNSLWWAAGRLSLHASRPKVNENK